MKSEIRAVVDMIHAQADLSRGLPKLIRSVDRLPGDASTRVYYRVTAETGQTFILMIMEKFADQGENVLFISVQKHFAKAGVDVPKIIDFDPERGFIFLEDLGDVTLLRKLQEVWSSDVERHIYERVIDSLVDLQVKTLPDRHPSLDLAAYKLSFDHEKLMWEMNFTIEHFYQKYLKREINAKDMEIMTSGLSEICHYLADLPRVLAHRDFHCRNIMVAPGSSNKEDRLVMIDFQDARMGPAQYDLGSLLKDSYYQLEEAQIERLLNYYIARFEAISGQSLERSKFFYAFDMMSLQRNFKAIGSFASFLNRRGNATYLKFIGNTFENIRRTLLKYPRYSPLREVLFHYYYF